MLEQKENFLILERIYFYSKILDGYLSEMQKLRSLQKIKNFNLILKEIDKIIAYIDSNHLFASLQNAIKNDFFSFLEELNTTFIDNYNYSYSLEYILNLIDLQIELNKKFERSEVKILQGAFEIFASNLKESLTANLKKVRGKFQFSNQKVKALGYLTYFETEVENQASDEVNAYFFYYQKFLENISKLAEIIRQKKMMDRFETEINEKLIEILNTLIQCVISDVESLKNATIPKLRSFISSFGPLHISLPVVLKSFEFGAILSRFNDPIKNLTKYAVEALSEVSEISDMELVSYNHIQFLEFFVQKLKTFIDNIVIPLKLNGGDSIGDYFGKFLEKICKKLFRAYFSLGKAAKFEVKSIAIRDNFDESAILRIRVH